MTDAPQELALSPGQRRRFMLLAILLVIAVSGLLGEVAVRLLLRYNTPDTLRQNSLQYRPSTFTRHLLAPDQQIDRGLAWGDATPGEDDALTYRINRHGYRGADFDVEKSATGCRLAILGGSAVFDLAASEGNDWPHQVESLLATAAQELGIVPFEVINAGVPGHSSADAVGKLYADLWRFDLDGILLYNSWNDVKYFTRLSPSTPLPDLVAPHDPTADPFQNYRGPVDRLLAHSQLYVKLRNRFLLWRYPLGIEGQVAEGELRDDFNAMAPEQFRLNVEMVVDTSRNLGAEPILLTQATLVTAQTSEEDRHRIAYGYQGLTHDALVHALAVNNGILRQVAEDKGIDLLNLDASLSGRSELFDDHVHTSREGSRALAEGVAEFLEPRLARVCGGATDVASDVEEPAP